MTRDKERDKERDTAISEASIRLMVDSFYAKVRADEVLGPVFADALHGQWDEHMPRMYRFWSTLLLGTRSFQGRVADKHMALPGITPEHFARWLGLFKETLDRIYTRETAEYILQIAGRIAGNLQDGYFGKHTA